MRILWVTNIVLPEVAESIGLAPTPFGGWLSLTTRALADNYADIQVGVAMRSPTRRFTALNVGGIDYYALPQRHLDRFDVHQVDVDQVISQFSPDILHVEGTEMRHALRFLRTWRGPRVVSLQGVLNGIVPYELGLLPLARWLLVGPPRLWLVALALLTRHAFSFLPRLKVERRSIREATHVIGRTTWDEAHARALNSRLRYHRVGRALRAEFSETCWNSANHSSKTIFFGNGAVPLKGLHIVLRAVASLRTEFPGIRLVVAGESPYTLSALSLKRHLGYAAYIRFLVRRLRLDDCVDFCGVLSASEIGQQMSTAAAFVLGSLVENESATLGEAMMIGLPAVAAYSGGVPSMARDEDEVLFYRAEDPTMLAHQLRRLLSDPVLCARLSAASQVRARHNYDSSRNIESLVAVYESILGSE